jgi:predicted amidohydrolase YtcJ
MPRLPGSLATALLLCFTALASAAYAQADTILINGKIVTVDDRFSVVQALAIKDARIAGSGSSADMKKLAGPSTRVIDLKGKTVIPGLIDNHAHFVRAAQHWGLEVRWDGVTSRRHAVDMLRERARTAKPGDWIAVLGGWTYDQFTDAQQPFTQAELDEIAPNNPVALQLVYVLAILNSKGAEALGLNDAALTIPGGRILRDANGRATGVIEGGGASSFLRRKLPGGDAATRLQYARDLQQDLNRMGLTSFIDWGGYGFTDDLYAPFVTLRDQKEMTVRVFHGMWNGAANAEQTEQAIAQIRQLNYLQGDDWYGVLGWGETVFLPLHDNPVPKGVKIAPEQTALWRKIAYAVADRGMNLSVHANQHDTIAAFLTEMESINKERPIRGLRWSLAHVREFRLEDIERVRKLGLYLQVHSQATISGAGLHRAYGDAAFDQTPLRLIADSGLPYGIGSDSNGAAPANPFYTLWWAVTGKMLGG